MPSLTINDERLDTSGALGVFHAASDELNRRCGGVGDRHLRIDELNPPLGNFLVARYDGHPAGCVGTSGRSRGSGSDRTYVNAVSRRP